MTQGVAELDRTNDTTVFMPLKRISKFELAPEDYETVMTWSKELPMSPESILDRLENWRNFVDYELCDWQFEKLAEFDLAVENGKIISLVWDFKQLPIAISDWCDRLKIRTLECLGSCTLPDEVLQPKLEDLVRLRVKSAGLEKLKLTGVSCTLTVRRIQALRTKILIMVVCRFLMTLWLKNFPLSQDGVVC